MSISMILTMLLVSTITTIIMKIILNIYHKNIGDRETEEEAKTRNALIIGGSIIAIVVLFCIGNQLGKSVWKDSVLTKEESDSVLENETESSTNHNSQELVVNTNSLHNTQGSSNAQSSSDIYEYIVDLASGQYENNQADNSEVIEQTQVAVSLPTINVAAPVTSVYSAEDYSGTELSFNRAEVVTYPGSIYVEDQKDEFTFVASNSGKYRIDFTGIMSGTVLDVDIYDAWNSKIDGLSYCQNGDGLTISLNAGDTFVVRVAQYIGFGDYTISVSYPKPCNEITGAVKVNDSITYEDQRNFYGINITEPGYYRFEMSGMNGDCAVSMKLYNALEECVDSESYSKNGNGFTTKLEAGYYRLGIFQNSNYTDQYQLTIGYQKPERDVSNYNVINDNIRFEDQRNFYTYVVPVTGDYHFETLNIMNDMYVGLYIYNELGETIASDGYLPNNGGCTVKDLQAGSKLRICIRQGRNAGTFQLKINVPQSPIEVSGPAKISDQITFEDQVNVINYKAERSGSVSIKINNMTNGNYTLIRVKNSLGETIESDGYFNNDSEITFQTNAGSTYQIRISEMNGATPYELNIR